jgi:hypothetical protein
VVVLDLDFQHVEGVAEGHLAMHFERQVEVVVLDLDFQHVEGVAEGHLAMHFERQVEVVVLDLDLQHVEGVAEVLDLDSEPVEGVVEVHLAMRFEERYGEAVHPDFDLQCVEAVVGPMEVVQVVQVVNFELDLEHVEGVAGVHLAMHFDDRQKVVVALKVRVVLTRGLDLGRFF